MIDMEQMIYANDDVFTFLIYYFLDEISDPYFERELAAETERTQNERWNLCQHMAAWLPYEKNYKLILQRIYEIAGADME